MNVLLKKKEYIDGIEGLKKFYLDSDCGDSTLWVVNEAAYYQVLNFPKLLLDLKSHGDIGLHTHFNSSVFNGMDYIISNNNEDYFIKGLIEPKKRLEQLLDIKIDIFKSGNHLKNNSFFKDLYDAGFNYDVTPQVSTDFKDKDGDSCANYTDWEDGCLPRYKNGILIIPEVDLGINKIKDHIDNLPDNAPALLRFQNHPWDYKDLTLWENVLNFCKKNYNVEFKGFYEMIDIFKEYQKNNMKVKLVIWDLDEVVWDGSLVENTIKNGERMVLSSHLIRYLNSHGIINSICSKNNFEEAKKKLIELELWDYFVFPKIQFSGKGNLVKQIIDECNFLPKNVLFIDDNHSNRKEVQFYNKNIMVEDEYFIFKMLNDGRFQNIKKKNRLPDYKILENKNKDLIKNFKGDNHRFLRDLNIKCSLDVINSIDNTKIINRIFELINRTNQLNYTKIRLESNEDIKKMVTDGDYIVYIVKGKDKYAYYGIIGTVIFKKSNIIHYCFSCRMMDTMIENFIYKFFDYPKININGNVTIPLDKNLIIDWIKIEKTVEESITKNSDELNHILFRGACDIQPLIPYLRDLPIVSDLNNLNNDTSIYHLTQNLKNELINKIKKDTNQLYNEDTFKININSNTDLLVFSLGDTYYQKILKHNETGILINNSRSLEEWIEKGANKKLFQSFDINEKIFEEHLKEFIKLYENKKIIFINCPEVDSDDNFGVKFKKLNEILNKFIDDKNIFLLDITKIIKTRNDLRDNGKYITHYKRESYFKIAIELKNKIIKLINNSQNKLYFNKKFMTVYNNKNINVEIENKIVNLKIINIPKKNYGVSFFYNDNNCNNNNLILEFECKINFNEDNNKIYPRVYTGNEWVELKEEITTEYKKFILNTKFNFKSNSQWRLSSNSYYPSQIIYIRNIKFIK